MISVCIATHNGEKFIKEQLDSIIPQLSEDDEIIISDDGSTDSTLGIIESFRDNRIKVFNFRQPSKEKRAHIYVMRNFENAIKHSSGDIIFLSDQDDKWLPQKVEICKRELEGYSLVVHNLRIANEDLVDQGYNIFDNDFHFKNYLQLQVTYYGCSMAFRRDVLSYVLPFPKKLLVHDFWIGLLAELIGSVKYINTPLILYRFRNESTSNNVSNSFFFKVYYRIYSLYLIIVRYFIYTVSRKY